MYYGFPLATKFTNNETGIRIPRIQAEQEGEFDAETRFALIWFEQYAFNEGLFGEAETHERY